MNHLASRIAEKRKALGMTQIEFAEKMHVTRQTVSRWENGTVMPDIDKIGEIADILGVSCDYLLRGVAEEHTVEQKSAVGRLLDHVNGEMVKFTFFEDEADIDLFDKPCRILGYEGNWVKVAAETKKGSIEKLIPLSSVLSIEIVKEEQ